MARPKKILLLADDDDFRHTLAGQLSVDGAFTVLQAESAQSALRLIAEQSIDVLLADYPLEAMKAKPLHDLLQTTKAAIPAIFLIEEDAPPLPPGLAVEQIRKPLRLSPLLARLRALIGASPKELPEELTIGPYQFYPGSKLLVMRQGMQKIHLTEKESAILEYLYSAKDRIVKRDQLLGEIWGYQSGVTTHTLETHIYRLRQKIEALPERPEILLTEQSGYRLCA